MAETITPATLPGAADVTATDGGGAVSPNDVVQLKDVLGEALGKQFVDDQSALKAVKDTFAYVGKAGKYQKAVEAVKAARGMADDDTAVKYIMDALQTPPAAEKPSPATDTDLAGKVNSLETALRDANFYNEHPELKPHKDLIAKFGNDPAEVIKTDEFKGLFARLERADEAEKSRSVIHSNPRLAAVTDKMTQAREAVKGGNQVQAKSLAMDALNEALAPK